MKIRRRKQRVSQARRLERSDAHFLLSDQKTSDYRRVALNGRYINVADLTRVDLLLRLTCQRNHVVSNDANADVVKLSVVKECGVALFFCERMAFITAGFGVEKLPASLSGLADCVPVPCDEVVERGIEGKLRPLVRCDGTEKIGTVTRMAEHTLKRLSIFRQIRNPGDNCIYAGLPHFGRIHHRKSSLLL